MTGLLNRTQEIGGGFPPAVRRQSIAGMHFRWWTCDRERSSAVVVGLADPADRRAAILHIDLESGQCINRPLSRELDEALTERLRPVVSLLRNYQLPS